MRFIGCALALLLLARAVPVVAQDTVNDPVRAERLRQLIEERFGERLKEELGLTADQTSRLRVAMAGLAARRRIMEQEERSLRLALAGQLRPGIAANPDSVGRLVDAITNQRIAYAQTFRDEMRELSTILNPVQRGQYLVARDRLMQRVADALKDRQPPPGARPQRRRP